MESLSETNWDVVLCGTGLQQSLLALALSRSDKKILHIDPNQYYGGPEAAFSLQEADAWAAENATAPATSVFASAIVTRPGEATDSGPKLSFPRAYSLSLSPQLIHANSKLLSQLVSSRSYRQLEFLAVGSFFIYKPSTELGGKPILTSIPSTREDVFSSTDLTAREKRQLMKFMRLVLSYQDELSSPQWQEYADRPFSEYLTERMGLGAELRTYIIALTLSLDDQINTEQGLATIHRHLTAMGFFGPGFAAVYPKWGGGSEIAQVACRGGAVGGGVYVLGTGIKHVKGNTSLGEVEVELTDGMVVKTKMLVRGSEEVTSESTINVSRLIVIGGSPLNSLFEASLVGAPTPAVAVIALPPGSLATDEGKESQHPIYVIVHSGDTGECPVGQTVLYLSTIASPQSKALLEASARSLLAALATDQGPEAGALYQLYYEQRSSSNAPVPGDGQILDFPPPNTSLAFDDSTLEPVFQAWKKVMGADVSVNTLAEYMVFPDREGVSDDDDYE